MITQYPASKEVIDYAHQKIHEGRSFSGGVYDSALADNTSKDILIQVGSASTFHALFLASVSGACTMQLFEGATFSSAGTAVTMSNHNRASSLTFAGTVTHTPTLTGTGTQMNGTTYVAAGDKHTAGASSSFSSEFILKKDTVYLFRVTNISGGAIKISMSVEGYQPTL